MSFRKILGILFFIPGDVPSTVHRSQATEVSEKHPGQRVLFRNGGAYIEGDALEPAEFVTGPAIPAAYKDAYTVIDLASGEKTPARAPKPPEVITGPVNDMGLPMGAPNTREELEGALRDLGVTFHPNNKDETLAAKFMEAAKAADEKRKAAEAGGPDAPQA